MTGFGTDSREMRGLAMARAAEAMLRALGGVEVHVLLPRPAANAGCDVELGLAQGAVEDVPIAPVVIRELPEHKFELLVAASTLRAKYASQPEREPDKLLRRALGIDVRGKVLRITNITAEQFAGAEYLFHVSATE